MSWYGLPSNLHADQFPIQNYSDREWHCVESRAGSALEGLAGTAFIMLVVVLVMVFVITHSGAALLLLQN